MTTLNRVKLRSYLFAFVFILIGAASQSTDRDHAFYGTLAMCGGAALFLFLRSHWSVAVSFSLAAWDALKYFAAPNTPFLRVGTGSIRLFDYATSTSFSSLLILTFIPLLVPRGTLIACLDGFVALSLFDSCVMMLNYFRTPFPNGIFHAASIDSFFIAIMLPVVFERLGFKFVLPILVAVIVSKASTGLGASCVAIAAYACASRKIDLRVPAVIIVALIAIAWLLVGPNELFSSTGRVKEWQHAMTWWWHNAPRLNGAGTGTFVLLGPVINKAYGETDLWFWLHNDWLQVLFENGFLGFCSVFIMLIFALIKSFKRPWLFSSLCAYAFSAFLQMPLRLFFTSLLGALLLRFAFCEEWYDLKKGKI